MSWRLLPGATRPRLLLGAAVALLAALAGTLAAVLPDGAGSSRAAATPDTVWPDYAETIAIRPPAYDSPLNVSIRDTASGDEWAALRTSQPDESIGFVAGTGQPNRWIVGAQPWRPVRYDNSAQPARLYLATMEPTLAARCPAPISPASGGSARTARSSSRAG